ncbi:DNA polymerase III subunit gamma/tau [Sphingomonas sp. AX6]|uniref:DNA polymerase III subunit gamma/tau n=1 Tax=Sphingomonas sp. AX6 TaxID=2653171 RepID=UPI0012F11148|nr:DNA polymerase III subunit gamma/tau [Sphingomonas sp. AX6]VXC99535.1 DNA polymerase III subunits gamma and tau [Sphingomonas sp. AX6]
MSDSLDLGEPAQPVKPEAYRVLARKYRPQTFAELIGQDAMVTTLGNAIKRERLAHAFLMTGVRGVGKTSTARLIAKALNCIGPDGQGGPTISPCGVCEPCVSIAEGRNIDVIEMDAASHTGVDDMRGVIDAARLAAFGARYKIYIIDEVHMLSKNAFNALLKTLEEPPEHVKFILATTEVNKVPITVLSRCQRFDLRRVSVETLEAHFARVLEAEGVPAEAEALRLIAAAAEGSVRDGLSILDQAIAHADLDGAGVQADAVRGMLGLSDRGAVRALFGKMVSGDASGTLADLRGQYDLGIDPAGVFAGLMETVHAITLERVGAAPDVARSADERKALTEWAGKLSNAVLHRLWQLLLKGHDEVVRAALPIEAAEMALLRVIHASQLPDPGDLARQIAEGAPMASPASAAPAPSAPPPTPTAQAEQTLPRDVAELFDFLSKNDKELLANKVRLNLRVIRMVPPDIETGPVDADLLKELATVLRELTGTAWQIRVGEGNAQPSLREQAEAAKADTYDAALRSPVVAAAIENFPEAELIQPAKPARRM